MLRLKNVVTRNWSVKEGPSVKISMEDRKVIKANLVEAIIFQPSKLIRAPLLQCIYFIAQTDFPNDWTELVPTIMTNFQSNDQNRIYGALCCLRQIFKRYQFKRPEERLPIYALVQGTFPILLNLGQALVSETSNECFEMMRILIKTFFLAISMSVPDYLQKQEVLSPWMTLILQVLATPLPQSQTPGDVLEYRNVPLLKTKKWAIRICCRLFQRFGHPSLVADDLKPFAEMFYGLYTQQIMLTMIQLLRQQKDKVPMHPNALQPIYLFMTTCVSYSALWLEMKKEINFLLLESVFDTVSLRESDLETWRDDPTEFVRKSLDMMAEFEDPRLAADNFLIQVVKIRTGSTLQLVLAALQSILATPPSSGQAYNPVHQEAALRMFGTLAQLLLSKDDFRTSIESLIVNHVFPEVASQHGFLRARAVKVIAQYSRLEYTNPQHFVTAIEGVLTALNDPELPVQIESAMGISRIVRGPNGANAIKILEDKIPHIFERFFQLFDQIGNEEVVMTFGTLIEQMGESIAPYALQLAQQMSSMFLQLFNGDLEDDDNAGAASQLLITINTILYSLESMPQLYPQIEQVCQPLMDALVAERALEFFSETCEMVTCFTYFSKEITPFMWYLVPRFVQSYSEWSLDYIDNLLPIFDNFISRDTERFLGSTDPNYLLMMLTLAQTIMTSPANGQVQYGAQLIETILAHCRGKVDQYVPDMVKLTVQKLYETERKPLQLLLLKVVATAVHYSPVLFAQFLHSSGDDFTQKLFGKWFELMPELNKSQTHRKMVLLSFSSLCLVPTSDLPAPIRSSLDQILRQTVATLAIHSVAEADGDGDSDDDGEGMAGDAFDFFGGNMNFQDLDENADVENNASEAELQAYAEKLFALGEGRLDPVEDVDNFVSPLDDVNALEFWYKCFQSMGERESGLYQQWASNLDPETSLQVQTLMSDAQESLAAGDAKQE